MVEEDVTWREFVYEWIIRRCEKRGSHTFTLSEIYGDIKTFETFKPENKNVKPKIRQQLQFLRDKEYIEFVDDKGVYKLRGGVSLEKEFKETGTIDLAKEAPERWEYAEETKVYTRETKIYARKRKIIKATKERLGHDCIYRKCDSDKFLKVDGTPYIEVHHIVPLCEGGGHENLNLSVLCAQHHRMAHFANDETRRDLRKYLLEKVEHLLLKNGGKGTNS